MVSGWAMYTYAYFAIEVLLNIVSIDTARKELTTGRLFLPIGKTNPTHLFVWGSYSTLEMMHVASSPILTHVEDLCTLIC